MYFEYHYILNVSKKTWAKMNFNTYQERQKKGRKHGKEGRRKEVYLKQSLYPNCMLPMQQSVS